MHVRSPSDVVMFCIWMRCRWRPESRTHNQVSPPSPLIHTHARAHTLKHTYICGMFVLTFLSFCLSLTHTHRGCFKPLSLPLAFLPAAASSNVFTPLPPPPPPSPPLHHEKTPPQKNHSLFLLYLPLTSKAHFSQRLPSVRY